MIWKLSVLRGARTGAEIPLARSPFTIGRVDSCDLTEPDAHVSRRHCQLLVTGAGVRVEDNASRNGVYVNGERVGGSRDIQAGDCIRVGRAIYCVGTMTALPTRSNAPVEHAGSDTANATAICPV